MNNFLNERGASHQAHIAMALREPLPYFAIGAQCRQSSVSLIAQITLSVNDFGGFVFDRVIPQKIERKTTNLFEINV